MNKTTKYLIAFLIIAAACITLIGVNLLLTSWSYLFESSFASPPGYFMTVSEMKSDIQVEEMVRVSGAVIGESIVYDESTQRLTFLIADVPAGYALVEEQGGLAVVLENAVNDPNRLRLEILFVGEKPELLRNMAQAIITGKLQKDGVFIADQILLQCPSRYEEAVPEQAVD